MGLCSVINILVETSSALYFAGVLALIYVSARTVFNLYTHFVIYFTSAAVDYRRFGRWALVTNATDCLGKAFAKELAHMGMSIVLVGQHRDKLQKLAKEIESGCRVEARYVVVDFTKTGEVMDGETMTSSAYDAIRNSIRDLEIGIVVNNVGLEQEFERSIDGFGNTKDRKKRPKRSLDFISCNCFFPLNVNQLVLPNMIKRGTGLVINISPAASQFVLPFCALYSTSMRFGDHFSQALSYECEKNEIIVQSIQPMIGYNLKIVENAENFASHSLKTVGKSRLSNGYYIHAFHAWIASWIPEIIAYRAIKIWTKLLTKKNNRKYKVRDCEKKYK
ncbi:very-long-chain 3-oxoacyl-CoA reductase-like [Styela clava]